MTLKIGFKNILTSLQRKILYEKERKIDLFDNEISFFTIHNFTAFIRQQISCYFECVT